MRALLLAGLLLGSSSASAQEPGRVTRHSWTSRIYPGTVRDYWVYVPADLPAESPAAVMVFQDGGRFVAADGRWRVPQVFDELIRDGSMPPTVGVFVDPGVLPERAESERARYNRSFEYDGLGDRYARFLLEEILPEVARRHPLTKDPNRRAIAGASSGASCAFTAAWNRPDAFRRVLSFIGSYTSLRGADAYPGWIRKAEPKPLRLFLQDGRRDLNIYSGDWWTANESMASALAYAGYDARFVATDDGHDNPQGPALLPDALRWLWRDWTAPITPSHGVAGAERHYVTEILDPKEGWQLVEEHGRSRLPADARLRAPAARGGAWLAEPEQKRIAFVPASGRRRVVHEGLVATALTLSPDQSLLAASERGSRWVWSFQTGADGSLQNGQPFYRLETPDESTDAGAAGLAVDREGFLYVATRMGVQICDQPGRVNAILSPPDPGALSSLVFGGPDLDTLFVASGDRVFRRRLRRRGLAPGELLQPPMPRL